MNPLNAKGWRTQSPGKPYSVQRVQAPRRHHADSLRFELRKGESYLSDDGLSSFRSEIRAGGHMPMNSEKYYGFSLYLPANFPIENKRLVLAQWWAPTKKKLGEVDRSPALQFRFAEGKLSIRLRYSELRVVKDPEKYHEEKLLEIKDFPLGLWSDFVVHTKWSSGSDGLIEAWWNGKRVVNYRGQTDYKDNVGPVFKFGLYRDDTPHTYVSYMSEVRIGDSFDAVEPSRVRPAGK
ncbi:MAG: polysaccharide lyase [Bdellovibrionota bacterium]